MTVKPAEMNGVSTEINLYYENNDIQGESSGGNVSPQT